MKKIILTLFGFILSVMSIYAQVAPVAGLTVVPNNPANPTVMTLTWSAYVQGATPATQFVIERSPNNTPANFTVRATIADVTLLTYVDNVTPDTYCYRIRATNNATPVVASTYFPATGGVCVTLPQPVAPALTAALTTPSVYTSISLTWTHAGTDATTTRFLIERSTLSATTGFSLLATVTVAVPSVPANFAYTDAPITPSNYYYRVRAANAFLFSPYSNVASVLIPALSAPTSLIVTPNGTISTSNVLTWTGNAPIATSYDVEVSSAVAGTYVLLASVSGATTTYSHNTTGGNYCYRVRATVGSAVSAYSNVVCTPVIPCTSAILGQPTSIAATTNVQVTTVSVTWDDNASGETGYKIYRSITQGFSQNLVLATAIPYAIVATQNATGYADNLVVANTTYYYVSVPYCGTAFGTLSDEVEIILGLATATEFLVTIRPTEFIIYLEWMANSTGANVEAQYEVERSIDSPSPNWQLLKVVTLPADTSATPGSAGAVRRRYRTSDDGSVVGLPFLPNTKYCYRVRSRKLIGTVDVFSDYSVIACATTPAIDAPTELTAIAEVIEDGDYIAPTAIDLGTTPKILLSWKDNSIFETKYIIERKRDVVTVPPQIFKVLDSVTTILGQKAAVRYTDRYLERTPKLKGLVPGAKYCYRVRAKLVGGSVSNYSNESCAVAYDVSTSVDVKLSNQVKLYPNPASKNFMISFEGVNVRANKAEIINVMGQKVAEQSLSSTTTEISLQNLKAGLYYVRIQSDKGTIVKKLVVEN